MAAQSALESEQLISSAAEVTDPWPLPARNTVSVGLPANSTDTLKSCVIVSGQVGVVPHSGRVAAPGEERAAGGRRRRQRDLLARVERGLADRAS